MGLSPEADVELEMDLQSILHGIKGLGSSFPPKISHIALKLYPKELNQSRSK
jgi:hypothetical protein